MRGSISYLRPYPLPLWNWAIIAIPGSVTLAVILLQPLHDVWLRLMSSGLASYCLYWFSSSLHAGTIYRTSHRMRFFKDATWTEQPARYAAGITIIGIITLIFTGLWALVFWY